MNQIVAHAAEAGPSLRARRPLDILSFVLSLRAREGPAAFSGGQRLIQLRLEGQDFLVRFGSESFVVETGTAARTDARLESEVEALARVISGACDLQEALRGGGLRITGEHVVVEAFLRGVDVARPLRSPA